MRTAAIHSRGGQLSSRQLHSELAPCVMPRYRQVSNVDCFAVTAGLQFVRVLLPCSFIPSCAVRVTEWMVACDDELRAVEEFPFLTLETRPPLQYPCKAKSRLQATFQSCPVALLCNWLS
ncbi:hypothetical protein GE21DRAFT_1243109 [Neurospora crassa]|nr:hypothetical protein B23L21.280 [imported] - Neurospora crassa [Neurospora crassa]KHE80082.1 hypothetical protein GE21DRAFT_1243109 [Neurospora crassa]